MLKGLSLLSFIGYILPKKTTHIMLAPQFKTSGTKCCITPHSPGGLAFNIASLQQSSASKAASAHAARLTSWDQFYSLIRVTPRE